MSETQPRVFTVSSICSGGHFNPAVSVSVYLIGGLNIILLIPYVLAQLCGGLIGAGLAKVSDILFSDLKNLLKIQCISMHCTYLRTTPLICVCSFPTRAPLDVIRKTGN